MTVNEVCTYFDKSQIVDTQIAIDREYFAATDNIFTDGEIKYHINSDMCIHITSVQDATYLIFVDREYETCLCVYKHIPDITCKYIMENLHILKDTINNNDNESVEDAKTTNSVDEYMHSDIIDINTFTCTECDSKEKMIFKRSETNPDILETKCDNCKSEYTFTPSKYYKLASKKVIYFKSEDSSRQIDIK